MFIENANLFTNYYAPEEGALHNVPPPGEEGEGRRDFRK